MIMDLFSKSLGQVGGSNAEIRDALREEIRSEVNIAECIDAHMQWKGRLQGYLDGTSSEQLDPAVICRDDQCALGKWIQGPAIKHFREDDDFRKLRADHYRFHLIAGNVVKKAQENDRAGSYALLENEYARVSREIIKDLTELDKMLQRKG
jgi:Chemoreceptor zinc-binding domain